MLLEGITRSAGTQKNYMYTLTTYKDVPLEHLPNTRGHKANEGNH